MALLKKEVGTMTNKWKSRKFWLTIIAVVYTCIATLGFEVPVAQVIVTDAVVAVWVLAEAVVDASNKK